MCLDVSMCVGVGVGVRVCVFVCICVCVSGLFVFVMGVGLDRVGVSGDNMSSLSVVDFIEKFYHSKLIQRL